MSKYIVGDIHGTFNTFMKLVDKILLDGGSLKDIVLVGDLVDRGPDSSSVVEFVKSNNISCVLGNHEQMMIAWFDKNEYEDGIWTMNGGTETLMSYGSNGKLLEEHVTFLKTLPYYLEFLELKTPEGKHLLVSHAGVMEDWQRRGFPLDEALKIACEGDSPSILWDRWAPADYPEIYQVFGHTPRRKPEIKDNYANVDTGCVFNRVEYDKLTCIKFPEMQIFQVDNIETKGYYS